MQHTRRLVALAVILALLIVVGVRFVSVRSAATANTRDGDVYARTYADWEVVAWLDERNGQVYVEFRYPGVEVPYGLDGSLRFSLYTNEVMSSHLWVEGSGEVFQSETDREHPHIFCRELPDETVFAVYFEQDPVEVDVLTAGISEYRFELYLQQAYPS